MSKLVLIGGLPGSGKTKFAEALKKKLPGKTHIHEVAKHIHGNTKITSHKYLQASEKLYSAVRSALFRKTQSLIVVKPFAYNWEIDPYLRLAEEYNTEIYFQDLFSGGFTIDELVDRSSEKPDSSFLSTLYRAWDDKTRRGITPAATLFV